MRIPLTRHAFSETQYVCLSATVDSETPVWNCTAGFISIFENNAIAETYDEEQMTAIIAPMDASSVTLALSEFSVQGGSASFKVLQCFDIECSDSNVLLEHAGGVIPDSVTSTTGIMMIEWNLNGPVTNYGFSASWSVNGKLSKNLSSCSPLKHVLGFIITIPVT